MKTLQILLLSAVACAAAPATPPSIVKQPKSTTWQFGATPSLHVTAKGSKPLHYQWYGGGFELTGETKSSIKYPHSFGARTGEAYLCVVFNDFGSAISDIATLNFYTSGRQQSAPPTIESRKISFRGKLDGKRISYQFLAGPPFTRAYTITSPRGALDAAGTYVYEFDDSGSINTGTIRYTSNHVVLATQVLTFKSRNSGTFTYEGPDQQYLGTFSMSR